MNGQSADLQAQVGQFRLPGAEGLLPSEAGLAAAEAERPPQATASAALRPSTAQGAAAGEFVKF
jgi:hypothetical protein